MKAEAASTIILCIFRKWSKVTNLLAGECFVNTNSNNLGEEEDDGDEEEEGCKPSKKVDPVEAMEHLKRLVDILVGFDYGGYDWKTVVNDPGKNDVKIGDKVVQNNFYDDLEEVSKVLKGQFALTKLKTMEGNKAANQVLKDLRFYQKHADIRSHQMVFRRCDVKECKPCKDFRRFKGYPRDYYKRLGLPSSSTGGLCFTQEEDSKCPGHYRTFLDTIKDCKAGLIRTIVPDSDLSKHVDRCEEHRCRKVFKSR